MFSEISTTGYTSTWKQKWGD